MRKQKDSQPQKPDTDRVFREILSSLNDSVFITDDAGRFKFVCDNCDVNFGYSKEEVEKIGSIQALLGGNVCDPREFEKSGIIENIEWELAVADGKTRHFLITVKAVDLLGGTRLYSCHDITNLCHAEKRICEAEEKIEDTQQRYQSLLEKSVSRSEFLQTLDATTDGIWNWNFKTDELFFSDRYYRMLGYEPGEFPADFDHWAALIHPEDKEAALATASEYLETKPDTYKNEFRLKAKNGDYRWVLASATVVERDENGNAVLLVGNHVDVTDRKTAELRLKHLYESVPAGILLQSADGYIIHANKIAADIFTMPSTSIEGRTSNDPVWNMVDESGRSLAGKDHPSMITLRTGEPIRNAVCGIFSDDPAKTRWLLISTAPIFKSMSKIPDEVLITFADITDRISLERSLSESKNKFETLVDQTPQALFLHDLQGGILEVNDATLERYGYTKEQLITMNASDIDIDYVQREDGGRFWHRLKKNNRVTFEARHKTKSGKIFPVEVSIAAIDLNGENRIIALADDISLRKQSEEKLIRINASFEEAQEVAQIGSWVYEIVDDKSTWSKQMYRIFGLNPEEGEPDWEGHKRFIHPDHWDIINKAVVECTTKGIPYSEEYKLVMPDGSIKWGHSLGRAIKDDQGNIVKLIGTSQDITKRKEAEEDLRKERAFLSKAQEIGKIGTWELDIKKNELLWTDENYRIFGLPIGTKLTYETFLNCVYPDDREYVDTQWKAAFDKKPYDIEHRLLVDGTIKWVREKAELVFDENGECIRGTGVTQDITDRKLAEEQLRRHTLVLDQIQDRVTVTDLEGIITYVNAAEVRALGYSREELIGASTEKFGEDPELGATQQEIVETTLREGTWRGEVVNYTKDGSEILMDCRTQTVQDGKGNVIALCGIATDITERKIIEERLIQAQYLLRETEKTAKIGGWEFDPNTLKL